MPLDLNAVAAMLENFKRLAKGEQAKTIGIGSVTPAQFGAINGLREARGLEAVGSPELVFTGAHPYETRILRNKYSPEDVIIQLRSALGAESVVIPTTGMTGLQNKQGRKDGNLVIKDMAVLELTSKKPRIFVYNVIPKGDKR